MLLTGLLSGLIRLHRCLRRIAQPYSSAPCGSDATHDDETKQEIAGAYYDDEITFEQLTELVGHEEATNIRVLKKQLSEAFITEIAEELNDR